MRSLGIQLAFVLAASMAGVSAQTPTSPAKGETIVLIGNGLPEKMQNYGHFETEVYGRYPNANLVVRNMGYQGDTPGFRPRPGNTSPWTFPGAEKFRSEFPTHYGQGHYDSPDQWLTLVKPDTVVAFFGFNESFDGPEGVENFQAELAAWVKHSKTQKYNGSSAPKIVLVSPIAFENLSSTRDLPDGSAENKNLELYAQAIRNVADLHGLQYVDLFTPTRALYAQESLPMTINGSHLTDDGYAKLAPILTDGLFGKSPTVSPATANLLHSAVKEKQWMWFNDYRMLNGVHVHGRRYKPYGNVNYPEEINKIREMTALRDQKIWQVAQGESSNIAVDDSQTLQLSPITTNFKRPINYLAEKEALEKFTLAPGYKIELFASESEFPDLRNPVQMSFDNEGRLWVSVLHSYPHYKPGAERPDDKILIFEDTNKDGRADKQSVFADGLSLPIGFEIAPGGVYASEEPNLVFLRDTDGDGRADSKTILLGGFDSHDTHHAISAYTADASGAFYMSEGRFLHSQVETPYGPERCNDGGVWRFDPKNWRLERYSQSDYNNPWAVAFDEWDQGFISDASSGQNWWALPVSAKMPYGVEIPKVAEFAPKRARPTSGSEFVSSRHFPADAQGAFMICNSIGFLGTSFHKTWDDGSGFDGLHIGDLVSSSDPNFRPVDLEFAPDGSLYIVDWHNALIGHMQHNARDPNRDSDHGRIYRITYPSRPLVREPKIAGASIPDLLENFKLPEYRARYRTRRELRGRSADDVIPALKRWVKSLDQSSPIYDRLVCEALWATWAQNQVDLDLLEQCLSSKSHQARAAAAHVLRYNFRKLPNHMSLFLQAANDEHPRVRLEAIVASSWLNSVDGARIALESLKLPFDRWMGPVFEAIMKNTLADDVKELEASADLERVLANNPNARAFLNGTFEIDKIERESFGPTRELAGPEFESYNLGREVFHRDGHCATCHQPNGQGTANVYPPLIAKNNPWLTDDDERLIKFVLKGLWGPFELNGQQFDPSKGVPPMPGFAPLLKDEEVAAVLNYVRQSFGNDLPLLQSNQVKKVRAATKERKDFYQVKDLMREHPIAGWEEWKDSGGSVGSFE